MSITVNAFRQTLKASSVLIRSFSTTSSAICTKVRPTGNLSTNFRVFSTAKPILQKDEDKVEVTFIRANGEKIKAKGNVGDSLLDVVVNNSLDFDGFGSCEGTLTCSTCHLIFSPDVYEKLPEKPGDEECDMLDLAYDLTDTSRLGCQITLTKEMNGLEIKVPATVNDARAVPK